MTQHSDPQAEIAEPVLLTQIVDDVKRAALDEDSDVDGMLRHASAEGLLPIMTLAGLLLVSPLSGIPLFSTITGLIIAMCAAQTALGQNTLWLPRFLRRRSLDPNRTIQAMERIRSVAHWLEARSTRRMLWLSTPPTRTLFLGIAALYGLSMPVMEVIPLSSTLLGLAVVLIGLGLLLRDGLVLLASLIPALIAATFIATIVNL